jgi:hypothetical protein
MRCSECTKDATRRVTADGRTSLVCDDHHTAIVKRIEQACTVLGRGGPNATAVMAKALGHIKVEDL